MAQSPYTIKTYLRKKNQKNNKQKKVSIVTAFHKSTFTYKTLENKLEKTLH